MKKFFLAAACVLTLTHCGCFSVLAKIMMALKRLNTAGLNIVADGRKTAAAEEPFIFNGVLYLPGRYCQSGGERGPMDKRRPYISGRRLCRKKSAKLKSPKTEM